MVNVGKYTSPMDAILWVGGWFQTCFIICRTSEMIQFDRRWGVFPWGFSTTTYASLVSPLDNLSTKQGTSKVCRDFSKIVSH